jgi:hypothetical protein
MLSSEGSRSSSDYSDEDDKEANNDCSSPQQANIDTTGISQAHDPNRHDSKN